MPAASASDAIGTAHVSFGVSDAYCADAYAIPRTSGVRIVPLLPPDHRSVTDSASWPTTRRGPRPSAAPNAQSSARSAIT